jgi:formylglycine-generating enzyme required for sulfatase activity
MTAVFALAGRVLTLSTLRNPEPTIAGLDCSDNVKEALRRAVAWEPEQRFADAGEIVAALKKAQADKPETKGAARAAAKQTEPAREEQPVKQNATQERNSLAAEKDATRVHEAMHFAELATRSAAEHASPWRTEQEERPVWSVASGRDEYGPWAAFDVKGVRQRMRWIPPGRFLMGSPETELGRSADEGPQHEVTLTRGYWLGETPVTQALWYAVMGKNPSRFVGEQPEDMERPVEQVSRDDCQLFLDALNAKVAGLVARLPTEAEWESGCRGRTTGATWVREISGKREAPKLDAVAWYNANSGHKTHPVGRKEANPYGLYDVLGNVWELCADERRVYGAEPATDPVRGGRGPFWISRGGSWSTDARDMRAAYRREHHHSSRYDYLGVRLAAGQKSALR